MNKVEISRTAKAPFSKRYGNFIGGKWVDPIAGKYFENTSPVNGRPLCEVARSDAKDVEAALGKGSKERALWKTLEAQPAGVPLVKALDVDDGEFVVLGPFAKFCQSLQNVTERSDTHCCLA